MQLPLQMAYVSRKPHTTTNNNDNNVSVNNNNNTITNTNVTWIDPKHARAHALARTHTMDQTDLCALLQCTRFCPHATLLGYSMVVFLLLSDFSCLLTRLMMISKFYQQHYEGTSLAKSRACLWVFAAASGVWFNIHSWWWSWWCHLTIYLLATIATAERYSRWTVHCCCFVWELMVLLSSSYIYLCVFVCFCYVSKLLHKKVNIYLNHE